MPRILLECKIMYETRRYKAHKTPNAILDMLSKVCDNPAELNLSLPLPESHEEYAETHSFRNNLQQNAFYIEEFLKIWDLARRFMFIYKRDPVYRYALDLDSLSEYASLEMHTAADFARLWVEIQTLPVVDLRDSIVDFESTEAPEPFNLADFGIDLNMEESEEESVED